MQKIERYQQFKTEAFVSTPAARSRCYKKIARYAYRVALRMGMSEDEARAARRKWKRAMVI